MDPNLILGVAMYAALYIYSWRAFTRPSNLALTAALAAEELQGQQTTSIASLRALRARLTEPVHVEAQRTGKRYKGA